MTYPTIPALPTPPSRSMSQSEFSSTADTFLSALPGFQSSQNSLADWMEGKSGELDSRVETLLSVSDVALASSNFKGSWSSLSGGLTVPSSVYHSDSFWMLTQAIPEVSNQEPGLSSSWVEISPSSDYINKTVRYSKLDNPICHMFKKGRVSEVLSGSLSWSRSSTAMYKDRHGIIRTAGIDEPREEPEGWLIEPTSTNWVDYCLEYDTPVWTKHQGATVSVEMGEINPDGTSGVYRVKNTAGTMGTWGVYRGGVHLGDGSTIETSSCWIRASRPMVFRLGKDSLQSQVNVDTEWKRYHLTDTYVSTLMILFANTPDGTVDDWVDLWVSQVERLPFVTSEILTSGATATRADDIVDIDGMNSVKLDESNTIFFEISPINLNYAGGNAPLINIIPEAVNPYMRGFYIWGGNTTVVLNYVAGVQRGSSFEDTSLGQVASTYDPLNNMLTNYADGLPVSSMVVGDFLYTIPEVIYFNRGSSGIPNPTLGFHIKDFRIYDFVLNSAEVAFLGGK